MYRVSVLLLCVCALAAASRIQTTEKLIYSLEEAESHFEEFIEKHNRKYSSEEEKKMRFEIFKENLADINEKNSNPLQSATFGITQFSDLTNEEFIKQQTCVVLSQYKPGTMGNVSRPVVRDLPDSFSWVERGAVTGVKNQGSCGSCWTFGTTGAIEGAYAIKYGSIVELSEQQVLDCAQGDCQSGGNPRAAMQYIQDNGGIEREEDYPYAMVKQQCAFDASKVVARVASVNPANAQSEDELQQVLYSTAPVAIVVSVNESFKQYTGGIFDGCSQAPLNHAVLLVGYGSENGVPFWVVKNSWGTTWGEQGYIRLKRGVNACGILNDEATTVVAA